MNSVSQSSVMELMRRAVSANQAGDHKTAMALCQEALQSDPTNIDCHFLLGATLLECSNPLAARTHLEMAHKARPDHPGILFALGNTYFQISEWALAASAYEALHMRGHGNAYISLNLAISLINLKELTAATVVLERALAVHPQESALWNAYGDTLNKQHRAKDAEAAFQRALAITPDDPDILANLALLYEQSNDLDQAETLARQGLEKHPAHASLLLTAARCTRRRKQFQDALALLENVPEDSDLRFRRAAEFERGRIFDSLNEIDKAYTHFYRGNMMIYEIRPDSRQGGEIYLRELDELVRNFKQDGMLSRLAKNAEAEAYSGPTPVFLMGFLRSGTTLMDTILQTNPNVRVLEEEPTLDAALKYAQVLPGGYPHCLATATPAQKKELRQLYWNTVSSITGQIKPEIVVIDKHPLNTVNVPLLFTLFPKARILFALRHPCDVILSCFMQMFGTSDAHVNYTSLEGSAAIYHRVMQAWLDYRKILPLQVHALRYEDLVRDKQGTMHAVMEFLELDAHSGMEHPEKARQRGRIYTPSYHQVIQPIYQDALNRWHRYRKYFDAALPILRPFIDSFGYVT